MKAKQFTEMLECSLTPSELAERSHQFAIAHCDLREKEDEKARIAERLNSTIKLLKQQIDELAEAVRTGKELRPVECELQPDWANRMMRSVRLDTWQEIDRRPMTPGELQEGLFEEEKELPLLREVEKEGEAKEAENETNQSESETAVKEFFNLPDEALCECGHTADRHDQKEVGYLLGERVIVGECFYVELDKQGKEINSCDCVQFHDQKEGGIYVCKGCDSRGNADLSGTEGLCGHCYFPSEHEQETWDGFTPGLPEGFDLNRAHQGLAQEDTFTAERCDECGRIDGAHTTECSKSGSLTYEDYLAYANHLELKNPKSQARKWALSREADQELRNWKQSITKKEEPAANGKNNKTKAKPGPRRVLPAQSQGAKAQKKGLS